jgi:hypothetical protein
LTFHIKLHKKDFVTYKSYTFIWVELAVLLYRETKKKEKRCQAPFKPAKFPQETRKDRTTSASLGWGVPKWRVWLLGRGLGWQNNFCPPTKAAKASFALFIVITFIRATAFRVYSIAALTGAFICRPRWRDPEVGS